MNNKPPKTEPNYRLATKISIGLIVVFSFIFLWLAKLVFLDQNFNLDQAVAAYAASSVSPAKTKFYNDITFLGSQQFLVPAYGVLILLFLIIRRLRQYSWRLLLTVVVGSAMMFGFKYLFGRERPLEPLLSPAVGHSFPSGHSFSSLLFFSILLFIALFILRKTWQKYIACIIFIGGSILVAMSRVYLGVHFMTDVMAGFSLAIIWVFINELVLFRKLPKLLS